MPRFSRPLGFLASLSLAAALVAPSEANACGGGTFYTTVSSSESAAVDGHRVVIGLSKTQTVLWDQIRFSGAPEDFAWIYPVKAGARIEVANDAWTEALDAATTRIIVSPSVECYDGEGSADHGSDFSCAPGAVNDAGGTRGFGGEPDGSVEVIHTETVGPYETKTISTAVPGALGDWLTSNGYKIPEEIKPILDSYVADGFDFIAMRLTPGNGVAQMKPVRVITPGPTTTFPMRMLAAGAGDNVALSVLVLSEGRVEVGGFSNVAVKPEEVAWDFASDTSNYAELRDKALQENGGAAFLTSYAAKGQLLGSWANAPLEGTSMADLYLDQARSNGEAESCVAAFSKYATSGKTVVDTCDEAGDCAAAGTGEIDSRELDCGGADDIAVALVGMHPRDIWLTRLEANLPKAALSKDLVLVPVAGTEEVSSVLQATQYDGNPCDGAAVPLLSGPTTSPTLPRGGLAILGAFAALALMVARRLAPGAHKRGIAAT